ncbi:unnamed protein product, partial [Brenthis ino]
MSTSETSDLSAQVKHILTTLSYLVEEQFKSTEVQKLISDQEKSFDMLFLEHFPRLASIYAHLYKVPVIQFNSFGLMRGTAEMMGASSHCILYPIPIHYNFFNLTIWETITNISRNTVLYFNYYYNLCYSDNEISKRLFGQDFPDIEEVRGNASLLFLNIHNLWDFNRPQPKSVINLSGIHYYTRRELPKDLQIYLDHSKNGVIYMSLGTNSRPSSLPINTIRIITRVFAQLPYNVLLKWDGELVGNPKNVKVLKWFPQSDLLGHPNIKVFITQGGLQSSVEAINSGVPLVALPLLIDQWYNTEIYKHYKIGIQLHKDTLTDDKFKNSIETVISDVSYRANIIKLRSLMQDQPQTALQRAVWWTEHVLQHGAKHLRAPAANMHWAVYYELELVFTVISIFIVSIIIVKKALSYVMFKVVIIFKRILLKQKFD